jgi:hypothetical protein
MVGAGVVLYVNNRPFGKVTGFRFQSATPRDATYGIDALDPIELAPTRTKINGTLSLLRTLGDGGAEGAGFTAPYEYLSRERYFSLALIDRQSDSVIFRADYCSVTNQSWDVQPKEQIKGVLEFEALDWSNEVHSNE